MEKISVIIIAKNESGNIKDCIVAAKQISDDIIVIDSGSTDDTVGLARKELARVFSIEWKGYGNARNAGAEQARNDWIFSLDADERVTPGLAGALSAKSFLLVNNVYRLHRINYFGGKKINYGSFAHDDITRLYNRTHCKWDQSPVHEKLTGRNMQVIPLKANLLHYAAKQEQHYLEKITQYAALCAVKYQQEGKTFISARRLLSPPFNFLKEYIFQLGLLDGRAGLSIAKIHFVYTIKKYRQLLALLDEEKKRTISHELVIP